MVIQILGSGTSTGVPQVGCQCPVCQSNDRKDKRLRSSIMVESDGVRLLIDCGPDFREQTLHLPFQQIDGVLITHEHYDHVGGLDDLRPFCKFGAIPLYTEKTVAQKLSYRMPYCFLDHSYPGVPNIYIEEIVAQRSFQICSLNVLPIRVMHGNLPILGYRIGNMAYITDMLTISEESCELLSDLDLLIVNALRIKEHSTHQNLKQALNFVERICPKKTFFIHMSHEMGLHAEVESLLPADVCLAFDGLEIKL